MKKQKKKTKSLSEFKDQHYGKRGNANRERLESGYEIFKVGYLLKEARTKSGMTQQELADKAGTTKSYISKIENNIKEARISTLQKIVELGLGGNLILKIRLS